MRPVTVRIMHPEAGPSAGPLGRWLADERARVARRHADGFRAAGAADVAIVAGPPDATSFGERLRTLVRADRPAGLVILGSGAIPLATARDLRDLVAAAGADDRVALANNRYSADVVAIAGAWPVLDDVPDLPSDNALPRWLAEVAGYEVADLRRRWRLAVDIDGPLDLVLIGSAGVDAPVDLGPVRASIAAVRSVAADRSMELIVAGRTSAATVGWLERMTPSRTRALIEERGLRTATAGQRPPASVLAALIERDGPESFGDLLAGFGDAAIVDTRVLMAARSGPGRGGLAGGRGQVRLGPAAARGHRRSVAPGADGIRCRCPHPHPARRAYARRPWSPPGARPWGSRQPERPRWSVDVTPGLRRDPPPDLDAVGEDEALVARIHAEIERDGPITFARFMDLALYDPDGGYYRAAAARPGRAGDFLTAPEAHPIFGAALARAVADAWDRVERPAPFVLREYGAGTGALGLAIVNGVRDERPDLAEALRYEPIEVEAARHDAIAARFEAAGLGAILDGPPRASESIAGVVLANEVLDALPTHRVVARRGRLLEVFVGSVDGALVDVEADPSTSALAQRLETEGVALQDGQHAEVCLALDSWVHDAVAGLDRGVALFIDYGYPASDLYDPVRRRDGTLRAYLRHRVHDDPYIHLGRQDLTAHVDVTAVETAAVAAGLTHLGTTTQAEFLVGLGTDELLQRIQADPATTFESYLPVRSALVRLLDPSAMGRFRVMAFGRDWPADGPVLRGFGYRIPAR